MAPSDAEQTYADYSEEKAMMVVKRLLEDATVEMPEDQPILRHCPTGLVFDSATNLAHFHRGWKMGSDTER